MELNSKKVIVQKSASALCAHLSDVKNFEQLMPETISKFEVIREDAFIFALMRYARNCFGGKRDHKPKQSNPWRN